MKVFCCLGSLKIPYCSQNGGPFVDNCSQSYATSHLGRKLNAIGQLGISAGCPLVRSSTAANQDGTQALVIVGLCTTYGVQSTEYV